MTTSIHTVCPRSHTQQHCTHHSAHSRFGWLVGWLLIHVAPLPLLLHARWATCAGRQAKHARGRHAPALVSAGSTGPFHMRLSRGLWCSCPYLSACLSRMRMLSFRYMVAVVQWPMLLPAHRLGARRVCEAPTRVRAASVRYMSHGGAARSAQASIGGCASTPLNSERLPPTTLVFASFGDGVDDLARI